MTHVDLEIERVASRDVAAQPDGDLGVETLPQGQDFGREVGVGERTMGDGRSLGFDERNRFGREERAVGLRCPRCEQSGLRQAVELESASSCASFFKDDPFGTHLLEHVFVVSTPRRPHPLDLIQSLTHVTLHPDVLVNRQLAQAL